MSTGGSTAGDLLRRWRRLRQRSQLELACEAGISARHLSFVETGRSIPSREMVMRLAEQLEMPLRERNNLLLAAGYAPAFRECSLKGRELAQASEAVQSILRGHEPYPALAFDRHWTLVAGNQALMRLLDGIADDLFRPPINVLRVALHPEGLAPRIQNLDEWRSYTFRRLQHQIALTDDPELRELLRELREYPHQVSRAGHAPPNTYEAATASYIGLVVRLRLAVNGTVLSFFSASTVFGGPIDVCLSELAIESFFPADSDTREALRMQASKQR